MQQWSKSVDEMRFNRNDMYMYIWQLWLETASAVASLGLMKAKDNSV